jgi:hypothetical protein
MKPRSKKNTEAEKGEIAGSHSGEYEDDCLLDDAPCSLVEIDRRFRGAYCLNQQGDE